MKEGALGMKNQAHEAKGMGVFIRDGLTLLLSWSQWVATPRALCCAALLLLLGVLPAAFSNSQSLHVFSHVD